MKPQRSIQPLAALLLALALRLPGAVQAEDLLYQLEPGSTITPWSGNHATGPSEALTGTFTLRLAFQAPDYVQLNQTALSLQSPSFTITLDPANPGGAWFQPSTNGSYFWGSVNCPQLSAQPLQIWGPSIGSFTGPATSPASVEYTDLYLAATAGGAGLAQISFEAMQVPEPSSASLLIVGLAVLAVGMPRPRGGRQGDDGRPFAELRLLPPPTRRAPARAD